MMSIRIRLRVAALILLIAILAAFEAVAKESAVYAIIPVGATDVAFEIIGADSSEDRAAVSSNPPRLRLQHRSGPV